MKTIFNETDKNEILARIEKLTPESKALWGKMSVSQMLAHSTEATKLATGEINTKFAPIQIMGNLFKKSFITGGKPFRRNSPTSPELKMVEPKEFDKEKAIYIAAINNAYAQGAKGAKSDRHPFFGKMTVEEWGILGYKHADHHLSQFGV
jgi:hypothetical protein